MASSRMVNIGISVDSQRAVKGLEKLRSEVDNLTEKLSGLQSKIKETKKIVDEDPNNKAAKSLLNEQQKQFEKTQKTLQKIAQDYQNMAQRVGGIDSMLQNISTANYNDLTWLRTTLTNSLKNRRIETAEELEAYRETAKRLQKVRDEILKRDIDMRGGMTAQRAKEVLDKPSDFSINEINSAITAITKMRDLQQAGNAEWVKWNDLVKNGTEHISQFNASVRRSEMDEIQLHLPTISDNELEQQKKYWQEMIAGAQQGSQEINEYQQKLAEVAAEEKKRQSKKASLVMKNLDTSSYADIKNAIATVQQLQRQVEPGSTAWKNYGKQIADASLELKKWDDQAKRTQMLQATKGDLGKMSEQDLQQQLRYWDGIVNGVGRTNVAVTQYKKVLDSLRAEQDKRAGRVMTDIEGGNLGGSIAQMQQRLKMLQEYRTTIDSTKPDAYLRIDAAIEKLNKSIKKSQAGFMSFNDAMAKAANLDTFDGTLEDLEKIQKVIKEGMSQELNLSDPADIDRLKQATTLLDNIAKKQQEMARINAKEKIDAVQRNIPVSSAGEIEEAIRLAKDLQKANGTTGAEYIRLSKFIADAEAQLKSWNDEVKRATMEKQFTRLTSLSKSALEEQSKYWQEVFNNAEKGTAKYIQAEGKLKKIREEQLNRNSSEAGSIMSNLDKSSMQDIERAIKMTEQLRDAHSRGSHEYEIYSEEIKKAKEYLQSYVDMEKQIDMEDKWNNLTTLSANALAEQKKYWQEMIAGAEQGSVQLANYEDRLKEVIKEENNRLRNQHEQVLQDPSSYSVSEVQEAIKAFEKLRDAQASGSMQWKYYNQMVEGAKDTMKRFNDEAKESAMSDKLSSISSASTKSLAEQKKYWQEMVDGAEQGSVALTQYKDNLKLVIDEETRRAKLAAEDIYNKVNSGSWNGTIGETRKAYEELKKYRELYTAGIDDTAITEIDKAIQTLSDSTKQAEQGFMSYNQALLHAKEVADGTFSGTVEKLQQIQKVLLEQKQKKLTIGDKKGLDDVNKALYTVETQLRNVGGTGRNLKDILNDIGHANFNELQLAAKQLEEELKNSNEQMDDFATKSAQLREVQARMKKLKGDWEDHGNVIEKTAKRLMAYVAVYGGFNAIIGKMKEIINLNLQLSDSMADVQKTTGLAGIELQELGREIERIDSRTSTDKLYEIAATAGQIGLKTQEDVLGFTKAANTITVALNELGTEGSANLMKIATLTGDVQRFGTEDALLKIGSAVNELTASSAATAAPITDFINRVGGIAGSANIAVHEMAALGAATDASAQSIEIAGTSMNKLITALMSNTENVAYAANISMRELKGLIDQGDTMQAIIRVFEAMQTMDRGGQSAVLKELGSEGARMNQYVATMVANLDMLKNQLAISRDAFDENVSVINEYNVKQESAMGILQRMKNAFTDMFVNSKMTVVLKDILEGIAAIPGWLEKNRLALLAVRAVLASILVMNFPKLLHAMLINLSAMYKILSGPTINAFTRFRKVMADTANVMAVNMVRAGASADAARRSVTGFTGAMRVLGQVIKAHPIMTIVSVITAVGVAWWTLTEETDKAAKATAELSEKHTRQIEEFEALRAAIEATNTSYTTRAEAMKEINSLYSKYLGFELSELDNYEKKKAALDYINARLKENQTLELANRQKEAYTEGFSEDTKEATDELSEALMNIPEIGAKRLTEAMAVIQSAVKNGITDLEGITKELGTHFDIEDLSLSDADEWFNGWAQWAKYFILTEEEALETYIENYAKLQEQLAGTDEYFNEQTIENEHESHRKRLELAEQQRLQLVAMEEENAEHLQAIQQGAAVKNEAQQIASLQAILKSKEEYLKTSEAILKREKDMDDQYLRTNLDDDKRFDLGNLTAKYGAYTRHQANLMNEMRDNITKMEAQRADAEKKQLEEEARLQEELTKENNEVRIAESKKTIEELKKQKDDLTVAITKADHKWQSEYTKLQTIAVSETRKQWVENTADLKNEIESLQIQIAGDPYAKGLNVKDWKTFGQVIENIDTANVNSLAAAFKRLSEQSQLMTADAKKFVDEFGLELKIEDPEELEDKIFEWAMMLRKKLKEHNRGTTGEFLFGTPKEELDGVLSKMETYFIEKQKQIREQYLKGSITNAEMNRRLQANDKEYVNARIELRKYLLNQNSNFIKEMYPGLEDFDLKRLRTQLSLLGDTVITEMENALAKDEDLAREGAIKIREAIQKELLKTNPFKSINNDFRESMDELQLLSSEYEREMVENFKKGFSDPKEMVENFKRGFSDPKELGIEGDLFDPDKLMGLDEESQRERMDLLKEMAEKSYMVDADGLRKMLESHEEYYNWVHNLDDEQMNVMLTKLQWFYDESLLKQKQYADQLIKEQESAYLQLQEKLGDPAKIQWQIENLKRNRDNLQMANDARDAGAFWAVTMSDETYEENINKITSYNMAIKKLEEDLVDANKKAADKADRTRREQERKTKEEMEASISALEAYYNEQEATIRKRALENDQLQATLDRELQKNTIARERDLQELRKLLAGDVSNFDPYANNGYKGSVTGTIFFGDNKNKEALQKQAVQIKTWGKALLDGIRNQIAKGEITIQEAIQKQKDKIEKILLEDNFSEKVLHEYIEAIDELGLLFNVNEDVIDTDRELGERRLAYMREWAEEAYNLNARQLQNEIEQNESFSQWRIGRTAEDYEALLIQLRKFHDDVEEADRKAAERRKKIFDNSKQGLSLKEQSDRNIKKEEDNVDMWDRFQGLDLSSEEAVHKAQIDMYKSKIEASAAYIEQIRREMAAEKMKLSLEIDNIQREINARKKMGLDTAELEGTLLSTQQQQQSLIRQERQITFEEEQKIEESRQEMLAHFMAIEEGKLNEVKKYTDAIVDFSYQMGEAAFGEVEDRKEAGKQLIKTLLTTLKDWIQIKTTELVMEKLFALQSTAISGQQTIQELSMTGSKATADVIAGTASATAKEAGSKGFIGLAIGAAIGAALSALLGVAMGAINKSKSEVQSISGVGGGRLVTGMLTYAEGNYPVLGNDGQVYNAKYEGAGIKTGIYRGGAHFGIFSEKKPEAIIDGDTTQRLIMNHPDIWKAIVTLSKSGRLPNGYGMRTFDTGNINELTRLAQNTESTSVTDNQVYIAQMQATIERNNQVMAQLTTVLSRGIHAKMYMFGEDGEYKQMKKAEKFAKRTKMK